MRNEFKTTIQVTRLDICDLMLACSLVRGNLTNGNGEKWEKLYNELERHLDELDEQLDMVCE